MRMLLIGLFLIPCLATWTAGLYAGLIAMPLVIAGAVTAKLLARRYRPERAMASSSWALLILTPALGVAATLGFGLMLLAFGPGTS